MNNEFLIANEEAMLAFGAELARNLQAPQIIFLYGDLGAGKTTLVRGILRALGHQGAVKSPTYTIVEPYSFANFNVYHFDLYRLGSADELYGLGIDDYLHDKAVCFIEWPERGQALLPPPDVSIHLEHVGEQRRCIIS